MKGRIGAQAVREQAVPLALLAALSTVAGLGFAAVFVGWGFAWIPLVGALTGTAASAVAIWRRLLVGESIALALGLFVVVGVLSVGGATLGGATTFLRGLVTGWAELLTSFTPLVPTRSMSALPFVISWFAAVVGGELLRATRVPALPAIGPLLAFALSLLFTAEDRTLAVTQGVVMVTGTLALGLVQQRRYRTLEDDLTTGTTNRWSGRGLVSVAGVLALILVGAPLLGPELPLVDENERFDLRQYLTPPFDPLSIPSPLAGIKGQLKDGDDEKLVFEVDSPDRPERLTTAVLGTYDGVVWSVAESVESDAGRYRPVDELFPPPPDGYLVMDRRTVTAEVTVSELGGHWLPRPGWVTQVGLPDEVDIRFNDVTGNVALPGRVADGLTYRITAVPTPSLAEVDGAEVAPGGGELGTLPPAIRNFVADVVQGQDGGWPQVTALVEYFITEGFYDVSETARPGHSVFRLGEFLADPDRIIGYEEQYAATAAIAVRALERPARVAVGYTIPPERWSGDRAEVFAGDVSAWIEVRTEAGWVSLDVTPDRSRKPEVEERGRTVEDVAVPNPPPPPPPPPDRRTVEPEELEEPEVEDEEEEEEPQVAGLLPPMAMYTIAGIGTPLVMLLLLALVVGALKARRRDRRRTATSPAIRVAGAWQELLERCQEIGVARRPVDSTREAATLLATGTGTDPATWHGLADRVDRAAFHPNAPSDEDAASTWDLALRTLDEITSGLTFKAKMRSRLDPRSLLRRDPILRDGDE